MGNQESGSTPASLRLDAGALPPRAQTVEALGITERRGRPRRAADLALQRTASSLTACLEQIAEGLILMDLGLRVLHTNGAARRIVEQSAGCISIKDGYLSLSCGESESLIRRAAAAKGGLGGETLLVTRGAAGLLLGSVYRVPVRDDPPEINLLLLIRNPGSRSVTRCRLFAQQFKLTRAELRLCLALEAGWSLSEYAEKYHISMHTVRTHLKSAFAKTGTHRQGRLMRLTGIFIRR